MLEGSTFALRLAIGTAGFFWLVLSVAGWGIYPKEEATLDSPGLNVRQSWIDLFKLVKEASKLKQVFKFLLAWIVLSDVSRPR
jgi:MFS-type transporter involved in bile tolerance (Atg22 family)